MNLLDWIYDERRPNDPVVLDNGHASLALYVVLEKHGLCDAEEMVKKNGTHADRNTDTEIWCSNGSLGQAATVAVGMALADPNRKVWLVTSDGSCMEGATWEAIRFGKKVCSNLNMFIVFNGCGAYGEIKWNELPIEPKIYYVDQGRYPEWLRGLQGHYLTLTQEQHDELMR